MLSGIDNKKSEQNIVCLQLTPYNAEIFVVYTMETKGFVQLEIIIIILLALSDSLKYLCYESTVIIHILILSVRGSSLYVRVWRL